MCAGVWEGARGGGGADPPSPPLLLLSPPSPPPCRPLFINQPKKTLYGLLARKKRYDCFFSTPREARAEPRASNGESRIDSVPSLPPFFYTFLEGVAFLFGAGWGQREGNVASWGGVFVNTPPPRPLLLLLLPFCRSPPSREAPLCQFSHSPLATKPSPFQYQEKVVEPLALPFFFFNCYQCFNALPLHPPLSLVPHALSTTTPSITTTSTHSLHTKDKKKCASCLFDKNQNLLRTSFLFIGGKRETLCFSILLSLWTIVAHIQLDRPVCVFLWTKTRNDRKTHFKMKPFFPSCKITLTLLYGDLISSFSPPSFSFSLFLSFGWHFCSSDANRVCSKKKAENRTATSRKERSKYRKVSSKEMNAKKKMDLVFIFFQEREEGATGAVAAAGVVAGVAAAGVAAAVAAPPLLQQSSSPASPAAAAAAPPPPLLSPPPPPPSSSSTASSTFLRSLTCIASSSPLSVNPPSANTSPQSTHPSVDHANVARLPKRAATCATTKGPAPRPTSSSTVSRARAVPRFVGSVTLSRTALG